MPAAHQSVTVVLWEEGEKFDHPLLVLSLEVALVRWI